MQNESIDKSPPTADAVNDDVMTTHEAGAFLKAHPRSLYRLIKEGHLPGKKIGGRWIFSRAELIRFLERR